tara:strand:- start:1010 stop:1243 length:234 start_codon:yes stop_codon:yes gene_type:complete
MEKKRTVQEIKADLKKCQDRFLDVMKRGDEALSAYDLSMGYDADFYLNRVPLLRNHVIYHTRELKEALKHGEQMELF